MSIRAKTLLITGSILLTLIIVLYFLSQTILMKSYLNLESDLTERNIQRAVNATNDEIAFLHSTSLDWAHWDDTYQYIRDRSNAFIVANVLDSVFDYYHLNFMIFTNNAGQVIYSEGYDPAAQARTRVPDALLHYIIGNEALIHPKGTSDAVDTDGVSGVVLLDGQAMMLASTPILHSDLSGPPNGALVWGSFIDDALIARLAEQTQLTLSIRPAHEFPDILPEALAQPHVIQPVNRDVVAGYSVLNDLQGQPALMLRIQSPRSIYAQGQTSLFYFLLSLVIVALIAALAITLLLDRGVLLRLARLNEHVSQIQRSGDMASRVAVSGNDEITSLSTNINAMLESLQAQEKIRLARDNALESARLRAEILANVSHDARTPLSVIILRVEMMSKGIYGVITDKQVDALENVLTSAQQLLGFVNNLLEGAQLESGTVTLHLESLSPATLLQTITTTLTPLAARKNLSLEMEIGDDTPATVIADAHRLDQVITNLISNAIKFTNNGSVRVRIAGHGADHWAIEVRDTGIGIAADDQKRIFRPFWQVDASMTRSANLGVGLGLSIVQQLVMLMGGEMALESAPGVGTAFTVILPVEASAKGIERGAEPVSLDY